jgi:hypothetical protein
MAPCRRLARGLPLVLAGALAACGPSRGLSSATGFDDGALADSVLTLVDSLVAVHQTTPDTGLARRLFPSGDTLLYVEGSSVHSFTGDSLIRRIVHAHGAVRRVDPKVPSRHVRLLGRDGAEVTMRWVVDVVDTAGVHHPWDGPVSVGLARRGDRWIVRTYRE